MINQMMNYAGTIAEGVETTYRDLRKADFPQYRYLSFPVYKVCAARVGKIAAVGISFFVTDLVAHQLLGNGVRHLLNLSLGDYLSDSWKESLEIQDPITFKYDYRLSLVWTSVGMIVMYAKYRREKLKKKLMSDLHQ